MPNTPKKIWNFSDIFFLWYYFFFWNDYRLWNVFSKKKNISKKKISRHIDFFFWSKVTSEESPKKSKKRRKWVSGISGFAKIVNLWNFGRFTLVLKTNFPKIVKLGILWCTRVFLKKISILFVEFWKTHSVLDFQRWMRLTLFYQRNKSCGSRYYITAWHGIMWIRWWHKRAYHMYSDVIFGWVLWIWLSSWNFYLSILILFSQSLEKLPGGAPGRRSFGRPRFNICRVVVASLLGSPGKC